MLGNLSSFDHLQRTYNTYLFFFFNFSVNVAKRLKDDSFALIFGINTMMALVFQTILTVTVISENGLNLGARSQFMVYAGYFVALAVIYGITGIIRLIWK